MPRALRAPRPRPVDPPRSALQLRRRTLLRALGLGIAAPVATWMARFADAEPSTRPVRLLTIYIPHGWPIEHVEPFGAGPALLGNSTVLAPLAPYAAKTTVVRGVSMNGASNHGAIRATLTGFPDGGAADSIDGSIADALGVTAHVLGAVPYDKGAGFGADSFLVKHGAWVRPTEDPRAAAADFFASLPGGQGSPPTSSDAALRARALALTERELEGMHAALADLTAEQTKLALHLEAVRHLKAGGGGGGTPLLSCDERPVLPAVDATAGLDVLDPANFGLVLDGHLEAIAAALVCGTAQVVTLQNMYVNAGLNFGFAGGPGIAKGHHDPVSHSWDAAGRSEFATCQRWFYERIVAKLLSTLDQPDPADTDPTRTVLDNTLIYVCSEVSDGANHNSDASEVWLDGAPHATYLPAVLIGGAGGWLAPGRVVDVSGTNLDLLATLSAAMGVPVDAIGGQSVQIFQELQA